MPVQVRLAPPNLLWGDRLRVDQRKKTNLFKLKGSVQQHFCSDKAVVVGANPASPTTDTLVRPIAV